MENTTFPVHKADSTFSLKPRGAEERDPVLQATRASNQRAWRAEAATYVCAQVTWTQA